MTRTLLPMLTAQGYGVTASYDGQALTMEGTNKAARMALAGQHHAAGPVVVDREAISEVTWKPAGRLTNGNLQVFTQDGGRYQLHFLRKHTDDMAALARQLGAQV